MPDKIDAAGLQVKSQAELVAELEAGMKAIYGDDINLSPNSPDGQLLSLYAQAGTDQRELLLDAYNQFAVMAAEGIQLDQRVALNGVTRKAATYTTVDVDVTVDRAVELLGLDELETNPAAMVFTVKDEAGNEFQLEETVSLPSADIYPLSFRAKNPGQVETSPDTITEQVTVVLGVTELVNPDPATQTGENEETDAQLRTRHAKMFALAATGPADSVEAALLAVTDVLDALVVENPTDDEVNDVPPHAIWAIVRGTATDEDIAQAIYAKRSPGCDMKGDESYVVTRPNSTTITIKWDAAIEQRLYVRFGLLPKKPGIGFDDDAIKADLVAQLVYRLGQIATIGDLTLALNEIAPNGIVISAGVSTDGADYFDTESPDSAQHYFHLAAEDIEIL